MGCLCSSGEAAMNPLEVDLSHFEMHKCVGRGGFGRVHAAVKRSDGKMYAIKTMDKQFLLAKEGNLATIWAERNVMAKFNSYFLVHLHHAFQDNNMLYLVMDFMKGGDLRYYLDKRGAMNENFARFFAAEILLALEEMHSLHIVYTDLKPENVLLDDEGHICISDFGLCVQLKQSHNFLTSGERGTDGYLAPEILNKEKYGVSPDVWTFGVMLYELLHNHLPFRAAKDSYKEPLMIKETYSDEVGDLLAGLLKIDPRKRLGCGQTGWEAVKRHNWFKSIDWEKAHRKGLQPPFKPDPNIANCSPIFDLEDQLLYEKKVYKFSEEQQAKFKGFNYNVSLAPVANKTNGYVAVDGKADTTASSNSHASTSAAAQAAAAQHHAALTAAADAKSADGSGAAFDPVFPEGRQKGMTIMEQKNLFVNPAPKKRGGVAAGSVTSQDGTATAAAAAPAPAEEATKMLDRGSLRMKTMDVAALLAATAADAAELKQPQSQSAAAATAQPQASAPAASAAATAAPAVEPAPAAAASGQSNPLADAMGAAVAATTAPTTAAAHAESTAVSPAPVAVVVPVDPLPTVESPPAAAAAAPANSAPANDIIAAAPATTSAVAPIDLSAIAVAPAAAAESSAPASGAADTPAPAPAASNDSASAIGGGDASAAAAAAAVASPSNGELPASLSPVSVTPRSVSGADLLPAAGRSDADPAPTN